MAETKRVIYYDQLSGNQPTNGDVIFVDNPTTGTHKMDLKSFVDAINNGFDSSIKSSGVSVSADNYSSIITNVNDQPVNSIYTYGAGLQSHVSNLPSNKAMTIVNLAQKSTGGLGQVMLAIERNGSGDYLYFRTIGGSPATWSSWVKVANNADVEAVREALDNLDIETDKTLSVDGKAADAKAAGDEINNLKADLVNRKVPITDAELGMTVSSQNGKVSANNTYNMVSFDVLPSSKIVYATGHNETAAGIAFYDINDVFISGESAIKGTLNISVPQTAYSAKACYRTTEENLFSIKMLEYVCDAVGHINNAEYTAKSLEKTLVTNRYLMSTWSHGGVNSTTGGDAGSNIYARSDYIKIMPNVVKSIKVTLSKGNYSDSLSCYIYIYNEDSYESYTGNIITLSIGTIDITNRVAEGQYIRCVIRDGSTEINLQTVSSIFSIQYDTIKTDKALKMPNYPADSKAVGDALNVIRGASYGYAMTKILCIGDSLTIGSSPTEDWGVTTDTIHIGQSYPAILARMLNCSVENAGHSGATAQSWYNNYRDKYNYADYDTCILWFGANAGMTADSIETTGSQANYYCQIIEKILTDYAAEHTDPDYGQNPKIIMLKCFAVASGTGTVADTNAAIDAIATKYKSYGIAVIDMSDLGYADHPELHENIDNPHFGKAGYIFIADRIIKHMNEWFAESPIRADFAQTPYPFYKDSVKYVKITGSYSANAPISEIVRCIRMGVNVMLKHSNNIYTLNYCNESTNEVIFGRIHLHSTPKLQFFDLKVVDGNDTITYSEKALQLTT